MSAVAVEIVRGLFDAFADGGTDLDLLVAALDPDVEMLGAVGGLGEGAVIRGREAVIQELLPDTAVWAERRVELQELLEGDHRVVALAREHRRGRGSGVEVENEIALIYTFAGDTVIRIEPYLSQAEALAAAGLGPV
jgi:ketosteroid isomerase-like protein